MIASLYYLELFVEYRGVNRKRLGGYAMNRKHDRKNKRPTGIPTGIMRLDVELMSEIRLFVSLGNTISDAARAYHVSEQMARYACRKGKDFDSLQKDILEEDDE